MQFPLLRWHAGYRAAFAEKGAALEGMRLRVNRDRLWMAFGSFSIKSADRYESYFEGTGTLRLGPALPT